jgi:periplasmic divalent cation tolerance protein
MTLVYITCKDENEAVKISKVLLKKRLIACSNMFPIRSMYWWDGKIQDDKEYLIVSKTQDKKIGNIRSEVKKVHSYDVPCIISISANANKEYEDWMAKEIK